MHMLIRSTVLFFLMLLSFTVRSAESAADPFAWLEDLTGERSLAWVQVENEKTFNALKGDPRFSSYYETALKRFTEPASTGIADVLREGWVYRLLQNESHPRGLWQRISLASYLKESPQWQPLIDVDRLSRDVGVPLTLGAHAAKCLGQRCIVIVLPSDALNGIGDSHAHREFDLESRTFVENGFVLPELDLELGNRVMARHVEWKDADTLYVGSNYWEGELDPSGANPYIVKEWSRGTPLSAAGEILRFPSTTPGRSARGFIRVLGDGTANRKVVISFDADRWLVTNGKAQLLPLPLSTEPQGLHGDQWILGITEDVTIGGRTWKEGSYVSIADSEIMRPNPQLRLLIEPSAQEVQPVARATPSGVLVGTLENVNGRLSVFRFEGGQWRRHRIELPDHGAIGFALTTPGADVALITFESYIRPRALYAVDTRTLKIKEAIRGEERFNAKNLIMELLWATSKDGTRVPYFVVRPKQLQMNGQAPTILRAYGNGGALMLPAYDEVLGNLWLAKGGVYVWASIRGGGELGTDWFVKKTERRRTYEDFVAVAEDLIRRKITSPRHMGIQGHSMGGALVGVMLNERPELFNAGVSENGVLDQIGGYHIRNGVKVYQARSPGVTDMWGSLDVPEERAFLESTSPYQNLRKRKDSPSPLIMTSTNDGIPAFEARKYVAKLNSFGMPYFFHESPEGGHGFGATPQQVTLHEALVYVYFASRLMPQGAKTTH